MFFEVLVISYDLSMQIISFFCSEYKTPSQYVKSIYK